MPLLGVVFVKTLLIVLLESLDCTFLVVLVVSDVEPSSEVLDAVVLGVVVLGVVVLGSVVLGSVVLGSVVLGSVVLGSVVLGSVVLGSVGTKTNAPSALFIEVI